MSTKSLRIAVIGTGLAGLTAAKALHDAGHEVYCFDKGRGVGGRMSVRRGEGFEFDHGAQYFTARDEHFLTCIDAWEKAGVIAEWTAHIVNLENGSQSPREPQTRYVGVPGMTALAKHLAIGLNVTMAQIASIQGHPKQWKLISQDAKAERKEFGPFDQLILSVPVVQARVLLADYPAVLQQIAAAEMEPCWAVMAGFAEPLATDFDGAFVKGSPLSWIARNNSKPGRSTAEAWVLHASADWSKQHLEQTPESIAEALIADFSSLTRTTIKPAYLQAHRWRYARASVPLTSPAVIDESAGIILCGDWCAGTRIEAAWRSGQAAADHLLAV
jgi:predicted NAD/FAD-dependent oxidoreductase